MATITVELDETDIRDACMYWARTNQGQQLALSPWQKQNGALLDGREHKDFPNARP